MKVIILAAGEGKRLRPYTLDRPKCLVPLAGRPLLVRQANVLKACGLTDITVMTGYRADQIQRLGFQTGHNPEYATTNMVASLMCGRELLTGTDDVLIVYADIVYEPRVIEAILGCRSEFCTTIDKDWLALWTARQEDPIDDVETLKIDEAGNICELGKKPKSLAEIEGQYMGLIKVSGPMAVRMTELFDKLDPAGIYDGQDKPNMYMTTFLRHLIDEGLPLKAVPVKSGWLEVDTTEDLDCYEEMFASGQLAKFIRLELTDADKAVE